MSESTEQLARALQQALRTGVAVDEVGWEGAVPDATTAYAVQDRVAALTGGSRGAAPACWKAGAPNTQAVPTFAPLPARGVHASPGVRERSAHFMVGIEAEVAFRVAREVTAHEAAGIEAADVPSLLDGMTVSIELVDSRWRSGMAAPALLRLADLQAHGALVLGPWVPFHPVDWQRQGCSVRVDGVEQGPYTASHPCGNPLWVVSAWLRHVAQRDGTVRAGSVVTTGTWCGIVWLQGLSDVHVSFEGIGQARLALL
jgi:2-keto-4-pentenoate hydratase